jgi:hypothetical protein
MCNVLNLFKIICAKNHMRAICDENIQNSFANLALRNKIFVSIFWFMYKSADTDKDQWTHEPI